MYYRVLAWLCVAAVQAGVARADTSSDTLARIRTAMAITLSRQPNYTCIQQVERSQRLLPRRRFQLHDVLRLEVALVDGREMFAWPGAGKFEDTDLTHMVTSGAIGTGNFANHARAVFQTSAPMFRYAGVAQMRGHSADRFDYTVPLIASGYRIKAGGQEATVGYHGSLWADASTHQLIRLEVNADAIPVDLGIASARTVMDYSMVRIGASDFLLPLESELFMVDLSGNESHNRTQFRSCRQYTGESVLIFDEAPSAPGEPQPEALLRSVPIPHGQVLDVQLVTDVDSESSAIGDAVKAKLDRTLKIKGVVLQPKGAILQGRISKLERNGDTISLDLQFSSIESADGRSEVEATIEDVRGVLANTGLRTPEIAHTFDQRAGIRMRAERIHLRPGSLLRLRVH